MIKIYGYSDDLIEIEGDVDDEWDFSSNKPAYILGSDGTILTIEYNNFGRWVIQTYKEGSCFVKIERPGDPAYSDVAIFEGAEWFGLVKEITKGFFSE